MVVFKNGTLIYYDGDDLLSYLHNERRTRHRTGPTSSIGGEPTIQIAHCLLPIAYCLLNFPHCPLISLDEDGAKIFVRGNIVIELFARSGIMEFCAKIFPDIDPVNISSR